jgi:hypothetical protein
VNIHTWIKIIQLNAVGIGVTNLRGTISLPGFVRPVDIQHGQNVYSRGVHELRDNVIVAVIHAEISHQQKQHFRANPLVAVYTRNVLKFGLTRFVNTYIE